MLSSLCYYWEHFLAAEINLILFLQDKLQPIEPFLSIVTQWGGPYGIEKFFIPLIGALHNDVMFELFTVTSITNLFTDILKLIFQFSRPFWWINETKLYNNSTRPKLYQNIFTCETSSGFPSGHSALFTVILLLQRKHVKYFLQTYTKFNKNKIEFLIDIVLSLLLGIMWITRLYFSCHFLHQCICGSLIAAIVNKYYSRYKDKMIITSRIKCTSIVIVLGLCIGLIYLIMKALDIDPQHSIRMAFKWCQDPYYLYPETTVMVSICSNLGTLLGVALTLPTKLRTQKRLNPLISLPMTIALIIMKHLIQAYTPRYKGRFVYLAWKLLTNLVFSFMMLWGVAIYTIKDKDKNIVKKLK